MPSPQTAPEVFQRGQTPNHLGGKGDGHSFDHPPSTGRSNDTSLARPSSALDHNGQGLRWTPRPKSTPAAGHHHRQLTSSQSSKISRPKTAAVILGRTECDRVQQLEHEPTRRHNLESHLPVKRTKPPPWQKNLEAPLVPYMISPGYVLSRSKTRCAVTIKDEFFEPFQEETRSKTHADPERDNLIAQLQQQISDLTLYLEEERLNHRQTKQKAEEFLKDKVDQINSQHQDNMRETEADHQEELLKQKTDMDTDHKDYQTTTEKQISRMAKDIEFLQGAFESYKSTLHTETQDKWKAKEEELNTKHAEEKQKALQEQKAKFIQDRNQERASTARNNQKALEALRKESKREVDNLIRRFSNAAADFERLKKTTAELEETKTELDQVTQSYNDTCQRLTNTTRLLTDAKVKLMEFEERFQEKVAQVDDKYRHKLHELMTQNTELKRLFVQKCSELFNEKTHTEHKTTARMQTAKETMETLIKSRQRANMSIALGGPLHTKRGGKSRPLSAPGTRGETEAAHEIAGEADGDEVKVPAFITPDINLGSNPETEELRAELFSSGRGQRKFSKEDLIKSLNGDF